METPKRTFEYNQATRQRVPLLIGLVSPSGGGKTFSALRLATGIQRVTGGDIAVVDTESKRALHYADQFTFKHIPFEAPFSPLDYLAVIEHCVAKGASTLVIDSMSHEHESIGGVLEWHQQEVDRMSKGDPQKAKRVQMLAWSAPKAARRRLINRILQLPINCIFCFRAKQKLKVSPGKEPEELGWMAISGEEFIYEMTANVLLMPKSGGVPTWESAFPGERATMKMPRQFAQLFQSSRPLDEDIGQEMAEWAEGDSADDGFDQLVEGYESCSNAGVFADLEKQRRELWSKLSKARKATLKKASDGAQTRIEESRGDAYEEPTGT